MKVVVEVVVKSVIPVVVSYMMNVVNRFVKSQPLLQIAVRGYCQSC